MRSPFAVLSAFLGACLPCLTAPAADAGRPNVILIMADDLGYRDLGCYGHPEIRTPVLDRLAAEGVRLTNFHSGATVCTPSRMALLTGAYPVRLGWTEGVIGYKMSVREGLSPKALTLAEIFRSEGYATGISGKWHIGSRPDNLPQAQGFDDAFFIALSNNQTTRLRHGDEIVADPFDNRRLTEHFTTAAIRFIREHHERPFFLYLPYSAPHFPVEAHPDWKGRSSFGVYGDVVEEMDARIGEIVTLLGELDLQRRTMLVFTSDNGPQKGQQATAAPYRGGKWSALEGGTRVPCIVHYPGVVPAGRESDELIAAIDLLPTLGRACGIDWQAKSADQPKIDGVDVWDTLTGADAPHARKWLLHWQGMNPEPLALQEGAWKLFFDGRTAIEGMGSELGTPGQLAKVEVLRESLEPQAGPFLYDLRQDPGELEDLSARHPGRVAAMLEGAARLKADLAATPPLPLTAPESGE